MLISFISPSIVFDIGNSGNVVGACAVVIEDHDNTEFHSAGCMAQRVGPSSCGARASARLLRTMALPSEPPLPHYVDGNGVIRDARAQVECRPQADTWGVVRDLNTGFVIILARGESAGIPGRQAGPFQHSRGQESRAWQPTSEDMAQAGMFTNVTGGSTATGSIYGTGHPAPMGWGPASATAPAPMTLPVGPCLSAPRTPETGPVYHSPCTCLGRQCGFLGVRQ